MTPPRKWLPRNPKALIFASLIGLLPIATGLGMLHWQVNRSLQAAVVADTERSVQEIDRILSLSASSAARLLPLAGRPCESVVRAMREEVTTEPSIRSASLVMANTAYCSTLYGRYSMDINPNNHLNGHWWLRAGNPITPQEGSLVYRISREDTSAKTVIDGRLLAQTLRLISAEATLIMQVGDAYLWSGGSIVNGNLPDHQAHHVIQQSVLHGYQIHGGYPSGMVNAYLRREAFAILGNLLLLGALTGGVFHWLLARRSPLRP